jgi:arylsulfatase A-like enzyme
MEERVEGESLMPLLDGGETSYDVVVTEKEMRGEDHLRFGFRTEEWKYLYDGKNDKQYLYDLDKDPDEEEDVLDEHPQQRERFEDHLRERLESIERTSEGIEIPDVDDKPGVEERLQALGYK